MKKTLLAVAIAAVMVPFTFAGQAPQPTQPSNDQSQTDQANKGADKKQDQNKDQKGSENPNQPTPEKK